MTVASRERRGGSVAFRLSDVPIEIRLRAAQVATRREDSFHERLMITAAAEEPSGTVWPISSQAWERVMGAST